MCTQHTVILSSLCKWKCQKWLFVLLNVTQYARPNKWRYTVRRAKIGRNAIRKGGVILMVMDCGINLIRFMIPDQVRCNTSQKSNILLKTVILQNVNASLPFYRDLGLSCTLITCECRCLC